MKEIKLTQGKVALVDDEDFDYLNQFKWYYGFSGVYRRKIINGLLKTMLMHREIMKTPTHLCVDHWDHNRLNNQKTNLRNCTHKENAQNSYKFFINNHAPDEIKKLWGEREKQRLEVKNRIKRKHEKQILIYRKKDLEDKINELQNKLIETNKLLIEWDN